MARQALLKLSGIRKEFPGCIANDHIDLEVIPGEIHALLGENGAGKSTLVKIIYGVLRHDQGMIEWKGESVNISSPAIARDLGIGMVFQHFSLFESMTTLENVALALPPQNMDTLRDRIEETTEAYGLALQPDKYVYDLSMGERQRIEIFRCLLQNLKLFILDEPTSVLTPQETEKLFKTLQAIAAEGRSILYISHKLEEVRNLCDRATILRGGKKVDSCIPKKETTLSLAEKMIGEKIKPISKNNSIKSEKPLLEVKSLEASSEDHHGINLKNINLSVYGGEIFGIAGIAGNGQGELMGILSGETGPPEKGTIQIVGTLANDLNPMKRRLSGAVFVPEERLGHAAVKGMNLIENSYLTAADKMGFSISGFINWKSVKEFSNEIIHDFDVRTTDETALASSLSGGNLQKFIVGRELKQKPRLVVFAQPTWGVDAGAATDIHKQIQLLAETGTGILIISQDLDEIFLLCDRIAVISQGTLSKPQPIQNISPEKVGLLMGSRHDNTEVIGHA